jgi:Flp pilus assembly protein TadD
MNERVSEALALLRGAAERRPDDISLRQKLFDACVRAGLFDEAVQAFTELVQIQPDWPQFHFDAVARSSGGSVGEFRTAFERAAAKRPHDALIWYGLGFIWQLLGNQEAAGKAFRRGIAEAPKFAALHYNLGITLMDDAGQAAAHLQRAVACSPTIAEPHFPLGTIYMTQDRVKATHHFREFIRLAPDYLEGYTGQARLSLQRLGEAGG